MSKGSFPAPATNSLRSKVIANLQDGANYRSKLTLLAPPAYATGQAYSTGTVVQNAGNIYVCQNSSGTSTSAPTATTDGQITDGTIKWLYAGPVPSAFAPSDDVPSFSFGTTPASCNRKYDFSHSGTTFNSPDDVASVLMTGATFSKVSAYGYGNGAVASAVQTPTAVMEFCTDAPIVSFNSYANLAAGAVLYATVNGHPLFRCGGQVLQSDLLPGGMILDFSSKAHKTRRIKVWVNNNAITGIGIARQYRIWQPKSINRYRMVTEGDSTVEGATPSNGCGFARPLRLASMLGCDDVWSTAVGGTGFLAGGANKLIDRIPAVAALAPDLIYIAPTLNDSGYTSGQRVAAYVAYFQALYASLPRVRVVLGTGWARVNAADTSSSSSYQIEADFISAVASLNNSLIYVAKSVTCSGGAWLTGDGNITTTSNSNHGNTDRLLGTSGDTLHPNYRGVEYLAERDYYAICEAIPYL